MIMENDENKKDLKGKRVAKKQARRNSRSSNSNSNIREQDKDVKNSSNLNSNKTVEINERLNQVISNNVVNVSLKSENTVNGERKNKSLKRKYDSISTAAGTSGTSTGASEDTDADDKDPSKDKKKKNRCAVCRKKVGLTGFECRCGGLFCAMHRYSDKHECSFDYRELGAQEIRRNNPVVVSQKIHKI